ncbi:uncharacterized protein LOC130994102 [Salvia miltiorrhiza]|uniref:uncharacterized protein LOC130994102 n=1 Tax=Salvia miltiorrhiza TaxID=226208 RepID=UPI0025ABA35F|nr:uncharacterized protein LOC130994102 [Salvia miltiorrhiza]
MVSPKYFLIFTFISLTSILSSNPNAQKSQNLINNICSQTLNPSQCSEYLQQLYRNGDSLQTLTQKTIPYTSKFLFLIYDEIRVREIQSIKNPTLNKIYHKCGEAYTAATNTVNESQTVLQSGDYQKLLSLASNALNQAQSCSKNFGMGESEPSDFKSLDLKGQNVCSIVLAMSKQLLAGKV